MKAWFYFSVFLQIYSPKCPLKPIQNNFKPQKKNDSFQRLRPWTPHSAHSAFSIILGQKTKRILGHVNFTSTRWELWRTLAKKWQLTAKTVKRLTVFTVNRFRR